MNKGIVCAILLGAAMLTCETVCAQEQTPQEPTQAAVQTAQQSKAIQTQDGVLSILVPNDQWHVMTDASHWFVISDGENSITIDHLANGETLPASAPVTIIRTACRISVFSFSGNSETAWKRPSP